MIKEEMKNVQTFENLLDNHTALQESVENEMFVDNEALLGFVRAVGEYVLENGVEAAVSVIETDLDINY